MSWAVQPVGSAGGGAAEATPAASASAPASAARLRYLPRCIVSLSSCASTLAGGRETTPHRKTAPGRSDERRLLPVTRNIADAGSQPSSPLTSLCLTQCEILVANAPFTVGNPYSSSVQASCGMFSFYPMGSLPARRV